MANDKDDKKKGKGGFLKKLLNKGSKEDEPKWSEQSPLYEESKRTEVASGYGNAEDYGDASKDFKQGKETPVVSQRSSRSGSTSSVEIDANELPSIPSELVQNPKRGELKRSPREKNLTVSSSSTTQTATTAAQSCNNMQDLEAAKKANPELFTSRTPSPRGAGVQEEQYNTLPTGQKTQYGDASQLKTSPRSASTSPSTSPRGAQPQPQPKAPQAESQYGFVPGGQNPAQAAPAKQATQSEQYQPFPTDAAKNRKATPQAPAAQQQYAMIPGEMKPDTPAAQPKSPRALPTPVAKDASHLERVEKARAEAAAKAKDGKPKGR